VITDPFTWDPIAKTYQPISVSCVGIDGILVMSNVRLHLNLLILNRSRRHWVLLLFYGYIVDFWWLFEEVARGIKQKVLQTFVLLVY